MRLIPSNEFTDNHEHLFTVAVDRIHHRYSPFSRMRGILNKVHYGWLTYVEAKGSMNNTPMRGYIGIPHVVTNGTTSVTGTQREPKVIRFVTVAATEDQPRLLNIEVEAIQKIKPLNPAELTLYLWLDYKAELFDKILKGTELTAKDIMGS